MATHSSEHSQAAQDYIDFELEEPFGFEDRLSPDEDDPLYDAERMELDDSDHESEESYSVRPAPELDIQTGLWKTIRRPTSLLVRGQ